MIGVKTFFSGSGPFVNRAILVGAVQVGTYDQFRDMYKDMGVKSPLRTYFQLLVICICFKKKEMSFHSSFCNLYNISLYMQIFFSLTFLSVLLFIFIFCLSYLVTVFYASMTSGLIYSLITMPLETAKNRMAFQKPDSVTGMYVHDMIRTTVTSYDIMQYRVEYCEVIQCTVIVSSVM